MTDHDQPVPDRHYAISDLPPRANTDHVKRKFLDIPYASTSQAQKLDIYLPDEGDGPFPVIVSIHGGAFMGCDKADVQVLPMLEGLKWGYAVVAVNYRLSWEAKFPALVQDAKAAIRWMRANAPCYGFDPDRVAAWGGSAGGYQATMLGVSAHVRELQDPDLGNADQPSNVQAVVTWFGPTDFLKMDGYLIERGLTPLPGMEHSAADSPESLLLGQKITEVPERVKAANPETYITADAPPFFIQHGVQDPVVPVQMSIHLAAKLEQAIGKNKVRLELLEGAGHGDPQFETPENVEKVLDWLDQHLKGVRQVQPVQTSIKRRMMDYQRKEGILYNQERLGPFPMDRIRRMDKPTNIITDAVQRIDMRDTAYGLADRGEYGPAVQKGVQKSLPGKYPLSAAQKNLIDHISVISANPVAAERAPLPQDPQVLTRHVKAVGYFLKADVMGACKVPSSAYYSHDKQGNPIDVKYENAIVIVMRKEWSAMRASKGYDWMGDPLSFQAYQHLGMVAETIANYVRRLGWDASAQYGPSFVNRYSVLLPPLLLAAGIGEVSRAGIILNPYLGLGFKAAAVLTHMPIVPDRPVDFGLQSFCQNCKICAQNCPSKAISMGDKVMYNGYETWKLDTKRCASFNFANRKGTMCNRCVKSCPWTNPPTWLHNLVREMVMHSRLAQLIAIRAAYLLGPGEAHPHDQWWFDMEYVDDAIKTVP